MTKVQEIFESLKEKHGDKFKPEQLNAWANMVQMQKHTSLDDPPPGRFFVITSTEQLKGWHDLMQKGGISKEQYEELQANILSEVKKY